MLRLDAVNLSAKMGVRVNMQTLERIELPGKQITELGNFGTPFMFGVCCCWFAVERVTLSGGGAFVCLHMRLCVHACGAVRACVRAAAAPRTAMAHLTPSVLCCAACMPCVRVALLLREWHLLTSHRCSQLRQPQGCGVAEQQDPAREKHRRTFPLSTAEVSVSFITLCVGLSCS
jgi:hypothetical protein